MLLAARSFLGCAELVAAQFFWAARCPEMSGVAGCAVSGCAVFRVAQCFFGLRVGVLGSRFAAVAGCLCGRFWARHENV